MQIMTALKPVSPSVSQLAESFLSHVADNIAAGDGPRHIALAVSGGADSMGLLALAAKLTAEQPDAPHVTVLSVDHGLRREAADEIANVAAACAKVNLAHHVLTADRPLSDSDVQQQARRLRYRLMAGFCAAHQINALVTAHHRQDQAETVLMRLARGSGVTGLGGMARKQLLQTEAGAVQILRPLLEYYPATLRALAMEAGFTVAQDPSNEDARFERVRWRQYLPRLAACGLTVDALVGLADDMRAIRQAMDGRLLAWLAEAGMWHDYGVLRLDRAAYAALPVEMRTRLMTAFVSHIGGLAYPPKRSALAPFAAAPLEVESGAATLGGTQLRWRTKEIFLGRETAACQASHLATVESPNQNGVMWDGRVKICTASARAPALPTSRGLNVAPLGAQGVQALRDKGVVLDDAVPSCYHTALAGVFDGDVLLACPQLEDETAFRADSVSSDKLFHTVLSGGQDW